MSLPNDDVLFCMDDIGGLSVDSLKELGWQNRYRQLIKWGDRLTIKPSIHEPGNLVKGCASNVWLAHREVDGRHEFAIDADARVIKGLVVLLLLEVQGRSQNELNRAALDQMFVELELDKHLSGSRSNGFRALLDAVFQVVKA